MKCKYCGHEYSKEVIRFCPKCGKNLIDDEANNVQTEAKEEVAATVIDNNSNSDSEPFSKIKRYWNPFRGALSVLLILVVLLILFEQATGIPVRENLFGMGSKGKKIYELAVKEIHECIPFVDLETKNYRSKYICHRGLQKEQFGDTAVNMDSYLVTVPTTIHFEHIGDRTRDLKVWIWEYHDEDNDVFKLGNANRNFENGFTVMHFWSAVSANVNDLDSKYDSGDYKEALESEEEVLLLVFDEMKAKHDADFDACEKKYGNRYSYYVYPDDYEWYWEYYVDKNQFPDILIKAIRANERALTDKYPDVFLE